MWRSVLAVFVGFSSAQLSHSAPIRCCTCSTSTHRGTSRCAIRR